MEQQESWSDGLSYRRRKTNFYFWHVPRALHWGYSLSSWIQHSDSMARLVIKLWHTWSFLVASKTMWFRASCVPYLWNHAGVPGECKTFIVLHSQDRQMNLFRCTIWAFAPLSEMVHHTIWLHLELFANQLTMKPTSFKPHFQIHLNRKHMSQ